MIKKFLFPIIIVTVLFSLLITTAVAWFCNAHVVEPEFSGSAITSYLVGDGTKAVPYKLRNATDVYNFAWLQYMGYFNKEGDDGKITQYYFELMNDIDMGGIIIPPIGTTEFPFVGHFKGNGYCISDVTVSNYLDDPEAKLGIVKRPLSVTNIEGTKVSITGFFGVVGALNDEMAAKLIDDSQVSTIGEKVNAVHDLFLDNIVIRTETDESLIGLLAGYVNCSISNVGIGQCALHIGNKTLPLSALQMQQSISMFSLIGNYHKNNVFWGDKPTGDSDTTDSDDDQGWGGSIDMMDLAKRVTYMSSRKMTQTGTGYYYYNVSDTDFRINAQLVNKTPYHLTSGTGGVSYLFDGTVLPLNVDTKIMFADENKAYTNSNSVSGLYTTSYYSNSANTSEIVSTNNTGYLISNGTVTSSAAIRLGIRRLNNVYKSYSGSGSGSKIYDLYSDVQSKMVILGVDWQSTSNTAFVQIADDYNTVVGGAITKNGDDFTSSNTNFSSYSIIDGKTKYVKYTDVRESLHNTFLQATTQIDGNDCTTINGIRFYKEPEESQVYSVDSGIDLGSEKVYDLLKSSIDFRVDSSGYITLVAGTFTATTTSSQTIFNLYSVERENGKISEIHQISQIYIKPNGNIVYDFELSQGEDTTLYTKVYDSSKLTSVPAGVMCYMELPVRAGEYAVAGNKGAYLMYLDIGANGNESAGGGTGSTETGATHTMTGITFVDREVIEKTGTARSTEGYSVISFSLDLKEKAAHGGLDISFNRSSKTEMTYTVTDPQSSFNVKYVKDDKELEVQEPGVDSG